jgi:hypothetical protein
MKFLDLKNKIHDFLRKIKRLRNKQEIEELSKQIKDSDVSVDFKMMLIDKESEFNLGKRMEKPEATEDELALILGKGKRFKFS